MYTMKINQQWKWGVDLDLPSTIYIYAYEASNTSHTFGTKLNYIINLQSTAIGATIQKFHQVLNHNTTKKSKI
jgi:hypothetical protein